jgi:2,4-dichlorophenol 6-monooxygenase
MLGARDPEHMRANMQARKEATPEAAEQRARLRAAIELKNYEFNAHGVELNQRYRSSAVVGDGTPPPAFERDPELYHQATTWPGARLPHCWVDVGGREGPPATWRATGALRS